MNFSLSISISKLDQYLHEVKRSYSQTIKAFSWPCGTPLRGFGPLRDTHQAASLEGGIARPLPAILVLGVLHAGFV